MIKNCSNKEKKMVLDYFKERFGIEQNMFREFGLYLGPKGKVFLGPKSIVERPSIITAGLLIARLTNVVKPSTNLLQLFGRHFTKNFTELTKEQALSYAKGEDLELSNPKAEDGYVLLKYQDFPLGCGLLKDGKIKNMLPKAKRLELKFM